MASKAQLIASNISATRADTIARINSIVMSGVQQNTPRKVINIPSVSAMDLVSTTKDAGAIAHANVVYGKNLQENGQFGVSPVPAAVAPTDAQSATLPSSASVDNFDGPSEQDTMDEINKDIENQLNVTNNNPFKRISKEPQTQYQYMKSRRPKNIKEIPYNLTKHVKNAIGDFHPVKDCCGSPLTCVPVVGTGSNSFGRLAWRCFQPGCKVWNGWAESIDDWKSLADAHPELALFENPLLNERVAEWLDLKRQLDAKPPKKY